MNASNIYAKPLEVSHKHFSTALILSILLGPLGIDRFYLGHISLGILKLLTLGGWGVWWITDIVLLCKGRTKDYWGKILK